MQGYRSCNQYNREDCPYNNFFTVNQQQNLSLNSNDNKKYSPCCVQCAYEPKCWQLNTCCSDIQTKHSRCKSVAKCQNGIYRHYTNIINIQPYQILNEFKVISSCQNDFEDVTTIQKCLNSTLNFPNSYVDVVFVSDDDDHDFIYRNKRCATEWTRIKHGRRS